MSIEHAYWWYATSSTPPASVTYCYRYYYRCTASQCHPAEEIKTTRQPALPSYYEDALPCLYTIALCSKRAKLALSKRAKLEVTQNVITEIMASGCCTRRFLKKDHIYERYYGAASQVGKVRYPTAFGR
jgi:hypothetical protein